MNKNIEEMLTSYKDNYIKNISVKSELIYGNKEKDKNPFITIAIPTYKRPKLLEQAIYSALDQQSVACTYEIIVVDNEYSTNITETERVVRSFNSDSILYYRNIENIGMFGNWNRCIELARGKWISFLHDDDLLDSHYLNTVCLLLSKKRDIGAISSSFKVFRGENILDFETYKVESYYKTIFMQLGKNKLMRLSKLDSIISNGNIFGAPTCGTIFRKDYLLELGGFDDDYFPSADWFLTLKFSEKFSFYKSTTSFGYYRILENESLNYSTLRDFITQKESMRKFMASRTKIGKLLKCIFDNEQYYSTLEWSRTFMSSNLECDGIYSNEYLPYRPIRYYIYKRMIMVYELFKKISTIFFG